MKKGNFLIFIAFCTFTTALSLLSSKPAYACLVEPCPAWPVQDGFYRVNDAGVVWQLYTEDGTPKACGIASGEHLANLGGEGRVTALSDIGAGRTWTGTCRVADGFYQVNAAGVVWQLYTDNGTPMACGIASGEHLARRGGANRVRTVPSGAEAGAQRAWTGTCPS